MSLFYISMIRCGFLIVHANKGINAPTRKKKERKLFQMHWCRCIRLFLSHCTSCGLTRNTTIVVYKKPVHWVSVNAVQAGHEVIQESLNIYQLIIKQQLAVMLPVKENTADWEEISSNPVQ